MGGVKLDLETARKVSLSELIDSDYTSTASIGEYTIAPEIGHHGEMTTVIDRVYDYIIKRETTTTKELSERLGIKQAQIERMVEMLEASHLIKLKYSVVPNGNIDILVVNKERERPREIPHDERIKGLKKVIIQDVDKLESAISSMEHHLQMWSSEAEEKLTKGSVNEQTANNISQEAAKIEKTLEHVRTDMRTRIASIRRRLSDMRCKVHGEDCKPVESKAPGEKSSGISRGLFNIKNPFNF